MIIWWRVQKEYKEADGTICEKQEKKDTKQKREKKEC